MKSDSLDRYLELVQNWENRVKQGPLPDWQEYNDLTEAIGREFCRMPPDYSMLMSPESETSFLHTFGEATYAFYVFCLRTKEVLIWPVILLRRRVQQMRQ